MNREDIQKLLGGYATGTLTVEEQQALFEAALDDQELFDALAREQSLRDLLRDPAAKAQLLAALDERPARWYERMGWWRPVAALVVTAGLAGVAVLWVMNTRPNKFAIIAEVQSPPASPMNQPVPAMPREAPAAGGGVTPRQYAKAEPPQLERDQALADQVNRPAADEKLKARGREEDRRAAVPATALEKKASLDKEVAATPPADAATTATPTSPLRSNAVAGFRDTNRASGGVVGGVIGGIAGGTPGGAPAAPPPPATRQNVQVQASIGAVDAVTPANARDLFYGTPPAQNLVAPPPAVQEQQPAPIQQQQRGQQGQQGAQAVVQLGAAAKALQAQRVTHVGVRYRLLRQTPGGEFVEADPDSLKTGDTVKVELTANEAGLLSVTSGGRSLFNRQVEKLAVYTTDALKDNERELSVRFARIEPVIVRGTAAFQQRKDETAANIQPVANERATYVMGDPASQVVRFTISLKYK